MIVSTTGIQTLGFSLMFAFGFEFPNSLADWKSAKEPTGFQPVVVELDILLSEYRHLVKKLDLKKESPDNSIR